MIAPNQETKMDTQSIRLHALELANNNRGEWPAADVVAAAAAFADFIANGVQSSRAKIDAALDAANVR